MIWDFAIIQQKHALTCPGLYRLIFQSLYHTSLVLPKQEMLAFWHPISKWEKQKVTGHMKHTTM